MVKRCVKCKVRQAKNGDHCRLCQPQANAAAGNTSIAEAQAALEQAAASDVPTHGLGDKIAVVAKAFGFVQTPDCGCAQRQENLNYVNFRQSPLQVAKDIVGALRAKKP